MPRYLVNLSRYVEQCAVVEVTATDPGAALGAARNAIVNDHSEVNWTDGDGMLSVNYKSAEPSPRYTVDGYSPSDDAWSGDGGFAPFRVFDVDAQTWLAGDYPARDAAQSAADFMNA